MRDTWRRPAGDTLAAWLMKLGPDSQCFCCGSSLTLPHPDVDTGGTVSFRLTCARCGAEVLGEDVADSGNLARRDREPALAAA
jgi:hypothetical protein